MKEMYHSKITSFEEQIKQLESALLTEREANKKFVQRNEESIFSEQMLTPIRYQWGHKQQRDEQVNNFRT
jgi:hypothetical protein